MKQVVNENILVKISENYILHLGCVKRTKEGHDHFDLDARNPSGYRLGARRSRDDCPT